MQVAVFDTYVKKPDGKVMHFDIIVPEGTPTDNVYQFGQEYLKMKGLTALTIDTRRCNFCHVEHSQSHMEGDIRHNGYFIVEMNGC